MHWTTPLSFLLTCNAIDLVSNKLVEQRHILYIHSQLLQNLAA